MERLIIIFFCIFLFSCKGGFKKEIPTYKNGGFDLFYEIEKQKEKQLNLDSLESGFDALQIRIWYDYSLLKKREVIVIKKRNGKWSADHYDMIVHWDAVKKTETIETYKIKSLTPKSGWDKFIDELLSLKVMTLPNMDDIPGLQDNWTDGVTYNVEIATKKEYRFYGYHLPDKFEDEFWQAKNMTGILSLISTELN